jgi:hypothetical protein
MANINIELQPRTRCLAVLRSPKRRTPRISTRCLRFLVEPWGIEPQTSRVRFSSRFNVLDALGVVSLPVASRSADRCSPDTIVYPVLVTALKAHVVNGRIVIDEPVDLPDGCEVRVYLYDAAADGMSAEERAALEQRLERSLAQADAGQLIDAHEVLEELRRS